MRQETNNEMDLLLRRLGRRQDTPAPDDHLDADELNSYAENVLPPAARVRYTEHLAECARCRELIVQLSSSAGVVVAQETATAPEPSGLRKFLASLFSPMVLRYAVPALGLVVVAAIGFMVSRNEAPRDNSVAVVSRPESGQTSAPASQPQASSSPGGITHAIEDNTKSVDKPAVKGDTAAETGAAAPPPNAPPTVGSINAQVQQPVTKVEQQQEEGKEAAPPPKATPAISEMKKVDPEVQKQPAENKVVVANEPTAEKAKTQERSTADFVAPTPGAARDRSERRNITALSGAGKREDDADKDKNNADTRTVAGRQFRKQGSAWIDTDYSSARAVISVTRDSEQYRALVADEPEIKKIADQLFGEIIVVWKGRTYRIR